MGGREIKSFWALGIVIRQRTNLKKLAEGHHKEWIVRQNGFNTGQLTRVCIRETVGFMVLHDSVLSGAWPFSTRGVTCQVYSGNVCLGGAHTG